MREVQAGFECGIGLTDFQDLQEGDVIETYEERESPAHLGTRSAPAMAPGRHHRSTSSQAGGTRYARSLRVNEVLRQVLAEELERLADADERLRLVTVTGVECAPDLRQATVYLSSISDEAAEALEERRRALQSCVGARGADEAHAALAFAADPAVVAGDGRRVGAAPPRVRATVGGRAGAEPEEP